MLTLAVILFSLAVLSLLAKLFLADFERFCFRRFLERLKRTTWKPDPSDHDSIIQDGLLQWPLTAAYVRLGDKPPYEWPYIDHVEAMTYFSLGPKDSQLQPPSSFTIYFPHMSKAQWPVSVEETPQDVLDATPHVDFVLVIPDGDEQPFYKAT